MPSWLGVLSLTAALCAVGGGANLLDRTRRRCFSRKTSRYFENGDEWTEPGCLAARCRRGRIFLAECPPVSDPPPPGCRRVTGREDADHPECCPRLECGPPPPGACFSERHQRFFEPGESFTGAGCSLITCGEGGALSAKICPLMAFPPGSSCSLGEEDVSLEYPQCCPNVTCSECHSEKLNRNFGPGETWTEPGCVQSRCLMSGDGSVSLSQLPCGLLNESPFPDCQLKEEDPAGEYPRCCASWFCPGRCFSKSQKRWFSVGDEWTDPGCVVSTCVGTNEIVQLPCPSVAISPDSGSNCRVVSGNPSASHPHCCPTVTCDPPATGTCFSERHQRFFEPGETFTGPGCSLATCGEGGAIIAKGCGLIAFPPGSSCRLGEEDISLEYPQCCGNITCSQCHSDKLNRDFGPGDIWTETGCVQTRCLAGESGSVSVSRKPCGLLSDRPFPDCQLKGEDSSGEYPECCASWHCPGRCFSKAQEQWFSVGDEWTDPGCVVSTCVGTNEIAQLPCQSVAISPDSGSRCRLVSGNPTASHPECCPTLKCDPPPLNMCFSERHQRYFEPGDDFTGPMCSQITCEEGGAMRAKVCPLVAFPLGSSCNLGEKDLTLEYPQCCPKFTCPECHSKKLNRNFGPGETWTETGCVKSRCFVGEDGSVSVGQLPCGLLNEPPYPDCQLKGEDASGEYPECCASWECPGRCFSESLGRWFAVGEEWTEEGCTLSRCIEGGPLGAQAVQLPCGLVAVDPDSASTCRIVEGDAAADYPGCCPNVQCDPPTNPY